MLTALLGEGGCEGEAGHREAGRLDDEADGGQPREGRLDLGEGETEPPGQAGRVRGQPGTDEIEEGDEEREGLFSVGHEPTLRAYLNTSPVSCIQFPSFSARPVRVPVDSVSGAF
jgi:hypothetical protein